MTASLEELMALGVLEARGARAPLVTQGHLFIGACRVGPRALLAALRAAGADGVAVRRRLRALVRGHDAPTDEGPSGVTAEVRAALARADALAAGGAVDADHVAVALLEAPDAPMRQALGDFRLDGKALAASALRLRDEAVPSAPAGVRADVARPQGTGFGAAPATPPPSRSTIDRFGRDLTRLAREGALEPVIGREREMKQIVRALFRKSKCNAVLVGDAGVGKTAIVEGLAQRAARDDAPEDLRRLRFVELLLGSMIAGTKYRGEFEERVQQVLAEAAAEPGLVLFLDEIHMMVGAGDRSGAMDAANLFKPALARGAVRVVGATTAEEYRESIEKDPALERRFSPVRVDEPTPQEARAILERVADGLAKHHGVAIEPEAIEAAIELSVRHLPDRRLPDKARDLLDQAASAARFATFTPTAARGALAVRREDVAAILSEWTGVPVEAMSGDRAARLARLEETLRARVLGQDEALASVGEVVRTGLAGLGKAGRPRGSLLFVGPTGVGKTELAKALAEALFGDERSLLRFDMSEYQDRFTAQRLLGAPPGYVGHEEGGQLVNAIRRTPYAVVLFDEIEKADRQVLDVLLQVLDDGRLTDAQGRVGDFSHAFVVLTSNLLQRTGAARARRAVGFRHGATAPADVPRPAPRPDDELRARLAEALRPELVGRIQRVVDFLPLGVEHLGAIADKALRALARQASGDAGVRLSWSPDALDAMVDAAPSLDLGARAIERLVETSIARPLADLVVAGRAPRGAEVHVVARAAPTGAPSIELRVEDLRGSR